MSDKEYLYGVLKGKVLKYDEGDSRTDPLRPHVYLYVECQNKEYKVVVNTKSSKKIIINNNKVPNDLLYIADSNFNAQQITHLQKLEQGFFPIKQYHEFVTTASGYKPEEIAVDFIRSNLFNPCDMIIVPSDKPGPDNDLADFFKERIDTDKCKKNANIYAYGVHFEDGLGVHDVHMNQGSIEKFEDSNGSYQDGCILIEYPGDHWEAIFLAFQSQSWCTDDKTGMATEKCFVYDHKTNEKICDIER
ncbi:YukJ family protein [Clostridium sp. UBA1056]|uniref:YukJ family protein n=1 Tax=unclassified Clostridium TaxID=2614128 RepID=UPI003217D533